MKRITILIADDHKLIRETWSFILATNPDFTVVAQAENAEQAIEQSKRLRPDIVLMDITLPGLSGIDAIPQIRKYAPGTRVIGISSHTQPTYAQQMIRSGASGYLTKSSTKEEMFKAICEIQEGRKYICEEIRNNMLDARSDSPDAPKGLNALSKREMEIIKCVRQGLTSKEISVLLKIAPKTVEVHRNHILKKLNVKNSASMVEIMIPYLDS